MRRNATAPALGPALRRLRVRRGRGRIGPPRDANTRALMAADFVAGERVGGFIVLVDEEGVRHAVRCGAVLALSDADETATDTVMVLPGGRVVTIRRPLREVLSWFG